MVSITKWVVLGGALIMLGLFTKEAAQTSLTSTLSRTGQAGRSLGGALTGVGGGIGDVFRGLFTPLHEVGNFARSFGFGSDLWGNSTVDPQSTNERIFLTGQGGGFPDAEQQGGGDTGVQQDPIGDTPNWFTFPQAFGQQTSGIFDVGGSDIKISQVFGQTVPLSAEARDWYSNIGVDVTPATQVAPTGGGSNSTTGGGGGGGSGVSFSSSGHGGFASGGGFGAAN